MSAWSVRSETTVAAVWKLLWRLVLVAGVVFACYRLRTIITTLLVAAIIAYVMDPIVAWLTRRPVFVRMHAPLVGGGRQKPESVRKPHAHGARHGLRMIATLYVFVLSLVVLWQGTRLVLSPFVSEFKSVTQKSPVTHRSQLQVYADALMRRYDAIDGLPENLKSDKLLSRLEKANLAESVQPQVKDAGMRVLESLKNIVEIVLLPVLAFYFLIDGRTLKHEFVALLPRGYIAETTRMLTEFSRIMRAFVAGQFILCLLAGLVVGLGLAALHVKYPVTLGVLAGITRAIPIIGPILGGIPIILLTWITKGTTTALAVLGFFTLLHLIESKFIMPMLIGDRMELHPVIIILVLLVGGEVGSVLLSGQLGALLGMFFAAPVASLFRLMIRRYWLRLPAHGAPGRVLPPAGDTAVVLRQPADTL